MKRLKSYPDELVPLSDKDLDRSQSLSSSSQHHRRLKLPGGNSIRAEQQARDRDERVEYGVTDERTTRRFEKRTTTTTDHEESNGRKYHHDSDDRGSRKRNEHESSGDGEGFRGLRKRCEDGFERRKGFGFGFERHRERDGDDRGGIMVSSSNSSLLGSPRGLYEREREREREKEKERIRRSESFCGIRREIPKGFRSERERSRRDDSVSVNVTSWRTFGSRSKRDGGNEEMRSSSGVEKAERSCSRGGGGGDGSSRDSLRSPKGVKDLRSPTWSKESRDSVGESKVKSLKKNEGGQGGVESGGSSNAADIEEGELQPEARLEKEPEPVSKLEAEHVQDGNRLPEPVAISVVKLEVAEKSCQKMESDLSTKVALHEEDIDAGKEIHHVLESVEKDVIREAVVTADEASGANAAQPSDAEDNVDGRDQESLKKDVPSGSAPIHSKPENQDNVEVGDLSKVASLALSQEMKLVDSVDLEFQADNVNIPEPSRAVLENDQKELELPVNILKDKGKSVVVCSPEDTSFRGIDAMIQAEFIPRGDDDGMEGPSTRGFDLFSTCVGTKGNQANQSETKHEKRTLEPLDLSLALPSVSLHVPASVDAAPPNSPPQGRSVQSLATTYFAGSDCFTTSVSFSGSQFMHNPSCSLTHNSMDCDFEQSVKSRPLFKNFDWQAHSASDSKQNEVPVFPKVLPNGNVSLHPSTPSQVVYTGQPVTGQPVVPFALDRSGSFKRQLSIIKPRQSSDMRSPTQSAGSYDTRSESGRDKRRAAGNESGSRLFRSSSQKDMQPTAAREIDFFDRILVLLVSEPIHAMSCRVCEMSEQAIACLKEHTREMIEREDRGRKLHALQEVLKNRSDLTLESLSKAHHVQLEILVALKTGLADFLQRGDSISLVDVSEIFLYLKCRNLNCGSALPVDDCDCKFCSRKEGFCSSCMCLVCSKFDTASNTCSWVGCYACSHWCHTDCGLQKSYIRNGTRVATSQGSSEMQFYCVACNHPSEMYGFVTDVFKVCASEWSAETMLKELEYVKRMFSGSTDLRGKLLHDLVSQLLLTLQNGSNVAEVRRQIMAFLAESDSKFINASGSPGSDPHALEKNKADVGNSSVGLDAEPLGFRSLSMKNKSMTESTRAPALNTEGTSGSKSIWDLDERRVSKINKPVTATSGSRGAWDAGPSIVGKNIPVMDDLEGIVKIKLAEAEMFQTRADNARGEAEGLRAIAVAKHQKAEEEYTTRIMKLRLGEAEERRRQKLEELQILERSHREYSNMKSRMEADIKLLLLKMEGTKRNMRT